ncbi:MAG: ACT domain-containing protein [Candidatus Dormibacteria bacterium]
MVDGSTDLGALLAGLEPVLRPGEYVFCSLADRGIPAGVEPLLVFQEEEGTTLVVPRGDARRVGLTDPTTWAWIGLQVHSSLEAVGLLAAVSAALAGRGIGCNVVSAYHHDHLFVPARRGEEALMILRELSHRARSVGG